MTSSRELSRRRRRMTSHSLRSSSLVSGANAVRAWIAASVGGVLLLTAPLGCASDNAAQKSAPSEQEGLLRLKRDIFKVDK